MYVLNILKQFKILVVIFILQEKSTNNILLDSYLFYLCEPLPRPGAGCAPVLHALQIFILQYLSAPGQGERLNKKTKIIKTH